MRKYAYFPDYFSTFEDANQKNINEQIIRDPDNAVVYGIWGRSADT